MNTKNLPNYQTYENNQIKIKRKTRCESCNLESIFKSSQNNTKTKDKNEIEADSFINI